MKKIKKLVEKFEYWDALDILEKEINNNSDNWEFYFEAAHIYRGVGEMNKALEYYEKAKKLGCEKAEKYINTIKDILKIN